MAGGISGFRAVLADRGAGGVECLGVKMAVHPQQRVSLPTCQSHDSVRKTKSVRETVPDSWKLTRQQQAFIDSFSEEDKKKQ